MMRRYAISMPCCFLFLIALNLVAFAEDESSDVITKSIKGVYEETSISGSNTLRFDYYDVKGDKTRSPYQYENLKSYDELNLNFLNVRSPYDLWRGQLFGLIFNDSEYRSPDDGIVPERLNLFHEKGDGSIPYRLEMGDYFGYFSYRTIQDSLKGFQFELQPSIRDDLKTSLLFISGASRQTWRDFTPSDNYSNGVSFLAEHERFGKASFNFIHNRRDEDYSTGALEREQYVLSVTGEKKWIHRFGDFSMESEVGYFKGDHDGITTPESGQNRDDLGFFLEAKGRSPTPFTYRGRYERYGKDYRPAGAVITPDRQAIEGYTSYRFRKGAELRGRIQFYRDAIETDNTAKTAIYGMNLSGPILTGLIRDLSGGIDAFLQRAIDETRTTDNKTGTLSINLSKQLTSIMVLRPVLFFQRIDNRIADSEDITTIQPAVFVDFSIDYLGVTGMVSPGLSYRRVRDDRSNENAFNPLLSISLNKGPHMLAGEFSHSSQNFLFPGSQDVKTSATHLLYRFIYQQHELGVEFNTEIRDPCPGRDTDSYRLGAFWTYRFEKPAKKPIVTAAPEMALAKGLLMRPLRFDELFPGKKIDSIKSRFEEGRIFGAVELPGIIIYDTPIFEEIIQGQRLALIHRAGVLTKSAVIIDFDGLLSPSLIMQTFERTREELIKKFGIPSQTFDRGNVTANLINDINIGNFIRLTEWRRPEGIIRFGIPRRMDGQIRMEVQFASSFPSPGETLWSIEQVK